MAAAWRAVAAGVVLAVALYGRSSCDTRASLRPLLLNLAATMDAANLSWCLDSGTLIGAIREGWYRQRGSGGGGMAGVRGEGRCSSVRGAPGSYARAAAPGAVV